VSERRAWDLVEDAMVDDELERLAKLTPEELDAEMEKHGIDEARARSMVERAIAAADAAEAAEAPPANAEAKKEEAPTKATPPLAKVVQLEQARAKRNSRILWFALAAGTAATVGVTQGQQIVAWISPPGPQPVPTATGPTPQENAAALREKAYVDCKKGYYEACEAQLDQADDLDPSGGTDSRTKEMRVAIASWWAAGGPNYVKIPRVPPRVRPDGGH
jgi:hypothetical protein